MALTAIEAIELGVDVTAPLHPLAAVLYDASLSSYCSACFAPLPQQPFPPSAPTIPQNPHHFPANTPTPLYCSAACSAADSPLHFSSSERYGLSLFYASPPSSAHDSSDFRLSLRLFQIFKDFYLKSKCRAQDSKDSSQKSKNPPQSPVAGTVDESPSQKLERLFGLMTNRENLLSKKSAEDRDETFNRIKEEAKMMALARGRNVEIAGFESEEMVFCVVITNAVEVQDRNGFYIGTAVYDTAISWFNHSCSPNCCYRFLGGPGDDEEPPQAIYPATIGASERGNGYGPRIVVRTVKAVQNGEEVFVSYTDLMQPKETRQAGLWLKHRFRCSCQRCVEPSYVDEALQAQYPENPEYSDDKIEKQMQNSAISDAIALYMSSNNAKSCCETLEFLLCNGDFNDKSLEPMEAKSHRRAKIHPFHSLSINAYTTLASAYKIQAHCFPVLCYDLKGQMLEALNLYKTGSAYSLLLAGVVNHLYMNEPPFVAIASTFWINAGGSLLSLARCSLWDDSFKLELPPLQTLKCDVCCLLEGNKVSRDQEVPLEIIKRLLCNCIANRAIEVWSFLSSQSNMLKYVENPVDFSWLTSPAVSEVLAADSQLQVKICSDQVRMDLVLLSMHCLRYSAVLSSIWNGLSVETNFRRALDFVMQI